MRLKSVVAILIFVTSLPLLSQVQESARRGELPLSVGAGFSDYYTEVFPTYMQGGAIWVDWRFDHAPSYLKGIGIEAEARVLNHGQGPQDPNFRQASVGGGPTYTWTHYRNFHPYAKFLFDLGGMDHMKFYKTPSWYRADRWATYAVGGGVEYRAWRHIWVRADYEYQWWQIKVYSPTKYLDPYGVTVGASYDFRRPRSIE